MREEVRGSERVPLWGMAALIGSDSSMVGEVTNISRTGIALSVGRNRNSSTKLRRTWLCRVVSSEFPDTLEFLAKVVRKNVSSQGYGLGCTITAINEKDLAMLEAFRTRRLSAAH